MKRCAQEERLMPFLLGDLPPAEAAAFRRHLASCAACRRAAHELAPVVASLRAALSQEATADLRLDPARRARVLSAPPGPVIHHFAARRLGGRVIRWVARPRVWLSIAASLVVFVGVALLLAPSFMKRCCILTSLSSASDGEETMCFDVQQGASAVGSSGSHGGKVAHGTITREASTKYYGNATAVEAPATLSVAPCAPEPVTAAPTPTMKPVSGPVSEATRSPQGSTHAFYRQGNGLEETAPAAADAAPAPETSIAASSGAQAVEHWRRMERGLPVLDAKEVNKDATLATAVHLGVAGGVLSFKDSDGDGQQDAYAYQRQTVSSDFSTPPAPAKPDKPDVANRLVKQQKEMLGDVGGVIEWRDQVATASGLASSAARLGQDGAQDGKEVAQPLAPDVDGMTAGAFGLGSGGSPSGGNQKLTQLAPVRALGYEVAAVANADALSTRHDRESGIAGDATMNARLPGDGNNLAGVAMAKSLEDASREVASIAWALKKSGSGTIALNQPLEGLAAASDALANREEMLGRQPAQRAVTHAAQRNGRAAGDKVATAEVRKRLGQSEHNLQLAAAVADGKLDSNGRDLACAEEVLQDEQKQMAEEQPQALQEAAKQEVQEAAQQLQEVIAPIDVGDQVAGQQTEAKAEKDDLAEKMVETKGTAELRRGVAVREKAKAMKQAEDADKRRVLRERLPITFNPFVDAAENRFSTFGIGVDTASYTLLRQALQGGSLPEPEQVRTEEIVNAFDYGDEAPEQSTFRIVVEGAPSPFGAPGLTTLRIGIKGRRLGREEQRPAMLTFLVDTSGSMSEPDRIGRARTALRLLLDRMGPNDRIQLITFDDRARLVLPPTLARNKKAVLAAFDALQCTGSTNLEEGMRQAYTQAARAFVPGGENRVILISDGVANLGADNAQEIVQQVSAFRRQGVTCSIFGVGNGTYNDAMLADLANKGGGVYRFLDTDEEVRRVFVDDLAATLNAIARDVKIQVEWSPDAVRRYRQLGYESRALKAEQFRDDRVEAGEVGSGQSVTALYQLERMAQAGQAPLGTVRVRYRRMDTGAIEEISRPIAAADLAPSLAAARPAFRLAVCAATFAELLRGNPAAAGAKYEDVARLLRPVCLEMSLDTRVRELLALVDAAAAVRGGGATAR